MLTPETWINNQLEKVPDSVRQALTRCVQIIYWVLFIESAISIVTGSPFARNLVLYLIENSPIWIATTLELIWDIFVHLAGYWQDWFQNPVLYLIQRLGYELSPLFLDIIALAIFSAISVIRSLRIKKSFDRKISKSLKPLKKSPGSLYDEVIIREILSKYPEQSIESDVQIVLANLDKAIIKILTRIMLWEDHPDTRYQYREAIINAEIIVSNVFGVKPYIFKEYVQLVHNPITKGEFQLTTDERLQIAKGIQSAIPYIFKSWPGTYLYGFLTGIFSGTNASRIARQRAIYQITFVSVVWAFVVIVIAIGWFLFS